MVREVLKLAVVAAIVVGAAVGFVVLQGRKGFGPKAGDPAPPLRLPAVGGPEVDLRSFAGRVVLVNFWATWCPPCVEEMPSLEKLHRTLGPRGLVVLGVSADEDEAALLSFLKRVPVSFTVLRDPGGRVAASRYRATGYPETFVIDGAGVIREVFVGPAQWDTPAALDHFRGLLGPSTR
jgi:cytochrome c biogenesis protein CcmG, thiol:disulfide interchange protein DsbE